MDNVKTVQAKILEIAIFIDKVCRDNNIEYFLMGGTALGAVRHKGFIPWDDDFDIFMTPSNYSKFKKIVSNMQQDKYYLQEWSVTKNYLEYSKLRMNGTTFIEEVFQNRKDMHHGIYVDIMILHKCPNNIFKQYFIYFISKYLTLLGLSQRNWRPKTNFQNVILNLLKFLPNRLLSYFCYKLIYKYDDLVKDFSFYYFITKAKFKEGIFDYSIFSKPKDIEFEKNIFMGPNLIDKYLYIRFGDFMALPPVNVRQESIHAKYYDTKNSYEKYFK